MQLNAVRKKNDLITWRTWALSKRRDNISSSVHFKSSLASFMAFFNSFLIAKNPTVSFSKEAWFSIMSKHRSFLKRSFAKQLVFYFICFSTALNFILSSSFSESKSSNRVSNFPIASSDWVDTFTARVSVTSKSLRLQILWLSQKVSVGVDLYFRHLLKGFNKI